MAALWWQLARTMRNNINRRRYDHYQSFLFSTKVDSQFDQPSTSSSTKIPRTDESYVLHQLSDLFSINLKPKPPSFSDSPSVKQQTLIRPDDFLAPEDKLRGIFLHKLTSVTAIEHALSNARIDLSLDVFAKVVNRGNLSAQSMLIFFNWVLKKQPSIPKHDVGTYNIIIKALGRRKFFTFIMDVLKQMNDRGVRPDLVTLGIVFDCYISARQVTKAIQLFNKLDEIGSQCDTASFNLLLQSLCRRAHVGSANTLFNSMKGKKIPYNVVTYNVVISGWAKFGNVDEIEKIFKVMIVDGFKPDCSTFAYLLEGLGRAGRVDDAVEILQNMEQQGGKPDTSMYNSMLSNFVSVKEFDKCRKYYENMLLSNNLAPNRETYKILIGAFLKVRRVADALEMFDQMLSKGIVPTTGAVTSFIEPLCNYGPPHAAMMIYKKARQNGCIISLSAYKLLLMRLSRFGKCGMMLSVWNEMQESGHPPDVEVYEHVINGLCNIGQLENAVAVMEESIRRGFCPSRFICSKVNNKLLGLNKVGMAYKLFLKIKNARLAENARKYWRYNGWHF